MYEPRQRCFVRMVDIVVQWERKKKTVVRRVDAWFDYNNDGLLDILVCNKLLGMVLRIQKLWGDDGKTGSVLFPHLPIYFGLAENCFLPQ